MLFSKLNGLLQLFGVSSKKSDNDWFAGSFLFEERSSISLNVHQKCCNNSFNLIILSFPAHISMAKFVLSLSSLSPSLIRSASTKVPAKSGIMKHTKGLDVIPGDFANIDGVRLDMYYTHPPGRPHGAESRVWSPHDSPVYNGEARKLGYKTRKGFQHI